MSDPKQKPVDWDEWLSDCPSCGAQVGSMETICPNCREVLEEREDDDDEDNA